MILSVNSGFFSVFECSFIVLMIFSYDKPISVLFYDKPPTNEHSQSQVLQKNSPFGSLPHRMRTNFILERGRKKNQEIQRKRELYK